MNDQKLTPPNRSNAVIAKRIEPHYSLDFFPTPGWATRALIEHVIPPEYFDRKTVTVLEPACGAGHMASPLAEYSPSVTASDIQDYGFPGTMVIDFLEIPIHADLKYDWVITNPPFKLGREFILKAMKHANIGVAVLVRTSFLEGIGRYNDLFKGNPPSIVAQFTERVPMIKNRTSKKATTATSYAWLVWIDGESESKMVWIPPCRKRLEKDSDYDPEPTPEPLVESPLEE